jgi:tetratricopeptide (TPR) repeat protein
MRLTLFQIIRVFLLAGVFTTLLPDAAHAYISLGFKTRKEFEDYCKAHNLDPKSIESRDLPGERGASRPWNASDQLGMARRLQELGELDKALLSYNVAIRLAPANPEAHLGRGVTWWRKKDYGRAIADYQEAVKQMEEGQRGKRGSGGVPFPHLHLAAAYAFCPDAKLRSPTKAAAAARRTCEVTSGYQRTVCVQILAAIHAHGGDFRSAVRWQTRAVELLGPEGSLKESPNHHLLIPRADLEDAAKRRLEQYRQGRTVAWDFPPHWTGPVGPPAR